MENKLFPYTLSLITSCLLIFGAHNAYASCDSEYEACLKYNGGRCEDKLKSCNMTACGEEACAPTPPAGIVASAPAAPPPAPVNTSPYANWPYEQPTTTVIQGTATGVGATAPNPTAHGHGLGSIPTGTTTITITKTHHP